MLEKDPGSCIVVLPSLACTLIPQFLKMACEPPINTFEKKMRVKTENRGKDLRDCLSCLLEAPPRDFSLHFTDDFQIYSIKWIGKGSILRSVMYCYASQDDWLEEPKWLTSQSSACKKPSGFKERPGTTIHHPQSEGRCCMTSQCLLMAMFFVLKKKSHH